MLLSGLLEEDPNYDAISMANYIFDVEKTEFSNRKEFLSHLVQDILTHLILYERNYDHTILDNHEDDYIEILKMLLEHGANKPIMYHSARWFLAEDISTKFLKYLCNSCSKNSHVLREHHANCHEFKMYTFYKLWHKSIYTSYNLLSCVPYDIINKIINTFN